MTDADTSLAITKPLHDKATFISFAAMACWAWFCYGFGATLAFLRDDQGTSPAVGGLHASAFALGGVLGALATPRLNHRFGRGAVMRVASFGAAAGMLIFITPGAGIVWTLAGAFITCFFGNLLVVGVSAFIANHQGAASAPALTENMAVSAFTGIIAPLTVGIAAATFLGWRFGILIAVIGLIAVEIARGRKTAVYGLPGGVASRAVSGALPGRTYWALIAGMCYLGAEFCVSFWGADLLREQVGLSPASAAAGLGALTGGLCLGRVFGTSLTRRMSSERLLQASIVAGLVAFFIMWSATNAFVMLVALFLTGVGMSLQWPLSMARILRSAGGRTDRAAGAALAFGTAAIGIAPFVLGALAGNMSVHQAFLLVPAMLAISFVLIIARPIPDSLAASLIEVPVPSDKESHRRCR